LYNASTVAEWLKAEAHNDKKLADLFERRSFLSFVPLLKVGRRLIHSTTSMRRRSAVDGGIPKLEGSGG
jgi:hypothetical protein